MRDVAIITGGAGSIGMAIARQMKQRGATVVATDVRPPVPDNCNAFVRCDVTDAADVARLFAEASAMGPIGCVVIAHGVLQQTVVGSADADVVGTVLEINLKASAVVAELAARHVRDDGTILLLSSATAFLGRIPGAFAYQASKGGIESLTRTLAVACAPRGVRVNCVAPGHVSVAMWGTGHLRAGVGGEDKLKANVPLGRLITPEEVALCAAFLCSDDARSITGVVVPVDGGQTAL